MNPEWSAIEYGGMFGVLSPGGVFCPGEPSLEAAQRHADELNVSAREHQRILYLLDLCLQADLDEAAIDEALAPMQQCRKAGALEQLAAQYGLLKPGTQS